MAVRQEENGTWTCYGRYPKKAGEKNKYYTRRGFTTKRDAKRNENELIEQYLSNPGKRMKLKELVVEYHKDAPTTLKESTLVGYIRIEKAFILPAFGERYIDEITALEIQRWINNIFSTGNNGQAYAEETVKSIELHLCGLFTYALKHDWIIKNPCKSVNLPKDPNKKSLTKSSADNYWEIDEFNKFIDTVKSGEHRDIYEFCFYTGLRIGELCALQWKHVDLKNKTITIDQSFSAITSKITTPKTKRSYRTIAIPDRVHKKLKKRYIYLSTLSDFNQDWFVFKNEKYISVGTLRRWFNKDVMDAKVKDITFHGLRHSHASFLLSNTEISEQLVADRLGHTINTLRQTYAHIYSKHKRNFDEYISSL